MKKLQLWSRILTGLTLALGATATFNQPSHAAARAISALFWTVRRELSSALCGEILL